jgi:hypothetical protein
VSDTAATASTKPPGVESMLADFRAYLADEEHGDFDDEFLRPTPEVLATMEEVMRGAEALLGHEMPRGHISPNGDGGIRVWWWGRPEFSGRTVTLHFNGQDTAKSYRYRHVSGDRKKSSLVMGIIDESAAEAVRWMEEGTE